MKRPGFRTRLFLILSLFALLPAMALTLAWGGAVQQVIPLLSGSARWERVAQTGRRAIAVGRQRAVTAVEREAALRAHEDELRSSLEQARRFQYLAPRALRAAVGVAVIGLILLTLVSSRVAGHLSRQLSRPIDELVGWTELIARGRALPDAPPRRGAPEFELLRRRMRRMARDLEQGRSQALEAERLRAFRESARQVAHELKNPLTPIRFAVERLQRDAPPELAEAVEVLATESRRLETMARSFAQFGRLPEGPAADVDIGEMVQYTARATVPPHVSLVIEVPEAMPMVFGHHDALSRALQNVLLNAVDACRGGGSITVRVSRRLFDADPHGSVGREAVQIAVRDTGCGMSAEQLAHAWEPYVTHKPGGTGLGLAIARQTIDAHAGTVAADSEPGRGTEVRFLIPVGPVAALREADALSRT